MNCNVYIFVKNDKFMIIIDFCLNKSKNFPFDIVTKLLCYLIVTVLSQFYFKFCH